MTTGQILQNSCVPPLCLIGSGVCVCVYVFVCVCVCVCVELQPCEAGPSRRPLSLAARGRPFVVPLCCVQQGAPIPLPSGQGSPYHNHWCQGALRSYSGQSGNHKLGILILDVRVYSAVKQLSRQLRSFRVLGAPHIVLTKDAEAAQRVLSEYGCSALVGHSFSVWWGKRLECVFIKVRKDGKICRKYASWSWLLTQPSEISWVFSSLVLLT